MAAPLQIWLTPEEDRLLLELSLDPKTHKKTRLWAAMVRLAAEGWTAPRIARHFHKDRTTVYLVLRRFLEQGLQGLAYRNVVGHLVRGQEGERLYFALLEGPVRGYLDRVAEGLAKLLKVFMDNAPFHRSREVEGRKEAWRERRLAVGYLPRYSPHLNPMESVWRRVKGFLMPRRHYGSLEELKDAVVQALKALGVWS